ncbi:hypothetical protein GGG87_03605 [Streptococcus sp. zg-86]|uniref:Uncharacterized protein n=2 Tax=Streptococcus zhangguiae TaxID=2664091 RepID=A0A6I4R8G1_9STRE|nr:MULTISPECIES: hypothetical protein [unclassified Streptococcus]MTB64088.1 hypothetical protein [Streptococcus sp. zg-86]MTB90586.1 hypothetical protein [Streptococcus sp. zg-36]MWV56076.1 hypothetical protein [Streptococcus sp. zg-70]QTH48295.1 hypothetical protein J5M87_02915 [Streptococcus sp. zg-86]
MNKRMKKKYLLPALEKRVAELERKNAELLARQTLLEAAQKQMVSRAERLEVQVSKNAEGTNKELDHFREVTKMLSDNQDFLQNEMKRMKKPWYKRK